jgi:hypothetical protein
VSSDEQKRFLTDILDEIERHKHLYRLTEFRSVIAKKGDGKWYNFVTLIKMLESGNFRSWEKQLDKDNLVILSAVISIDNFRKVLERLVNDQILELDEYQVGGPFNFAPKNFLDSEQSKRSYDIDWAVNVWRMNGKENFGLPDSRSLELESDDLPFSDTNYAIRYYTGISVRNDSSLQNAIHIVAPLYYGRIERAELSGQALLVETSLKVSGSQDFRIKYNTEGPVERSTYYETLEGGTVGLNDDTTIVQLKKDAVIATAWLYHVGGFKIDSRAARKKQSIEDLEKRFSQENPYLSGEDHLVITDAIASASKTGIPDLVTTELGVDSIDVEILKAMKTQGGDYAKFIPEVLKYISLKMLISRLARLRILGFLTLQPPQKILLTSLGVDAINLPPGVLSAKVPPEVDRRMAEIRSAFKNEDYDEVTNRTTRLLEALLRERFESEFKGHLQDIWPNLKVGPYDRASLGVLKEACMNLKIFEKNSISDHLISTVLQLRVPMSHEKEEIKQPSNIAFLTVKLLEAFLRNWYYLGS